MPPKKVYWDTSCFISYISGIHPQELARSVICEDVLKHARNGDIELWTSVWTIVETIRPKQVYSPKALPPWASLLSTSVDSDGNMLFPRAEEELEKIWSYYHRNTVPTRLLSDQEAQRIKDIFDWSWVRKIQILPAVSHRAAEIARAHNMKAGDSLHVASALSRGCDVIQRWDRDYRRTDTLIPSEDPQFMSPQGNILAEIPGK